MQITIIHDKIISNTPDNLDNLVQKNSIQLALKNLGHEVSSQEFSANLKIKADLIFNLVESIDGVGKNIYFAPALFENLKIPFTGNTAEAMQLTTNKVLTKIILEKYKILTPKWIDSNNKKTTFETGIIKSICEDASFNLDEHSIVNTKNINFPDDYFCEEFIDGREVNVSIIEINNEPVILPIAEIIFTNFAVDKPKIIGYNAKWNENSFEYKNTNRAFVNNLQNLESIAKNVWKIFKLSGYARIDFRIDKDNKPYILEINANPCLSPDSGFFAACQKAGMNYEEMIASLIAATSSSTWPNKSFKF